MRRRNTHAEISTGNAAARHTRGRAASTRRVQWSTPSACSGAKTLPKGDCHRAKTRYEKQPSEIGEVLSRHCGARRRRIAAILKSLPPTRRKYGSRVQCRVGGSVSTEIGMGFVPISICWHAMNSNLIPGIALRPVLFKAEKFRLDCGSLLLSVILSSWIS